MIKKLLLTVAITAALAAPAFAQDDAASAKTAGAPAARAAKIIIVDTAKVLDQATAARKAQEELKAKKADINANANKRDAELAKEFQAIRGQQGTLSKEDFAKQAEAFDKKVDAFKRSVNDQIRSVDEAERKALDQINHAMEKVVMDIAGEQGADIVLPKGVIIIADKGMEFTPQVVERLNKSLPSIKVEFKTQAAATTTPAPATSAPAKPAKK